MQNYLDDVGGKPKYQVGQPGLHAEVFATSDLLWQVVRAFRLSRKNQISGNDSAFEGWLIDNGNSVAVATFKQLTPGGRNANYNHSQMNQVLGACENCANIIPRYFYVLTGCISDAKLSR